MHVGCGGGYGVDELAGAIYAYVVLHAKVPLVVFLDLVQLLNAER